MDTDRFVLGIGSKSITKDFQKLIDLLDFSNLNKNHEKYWYKNEKVIGKFKIETLKNVFIDQFICLRSKAYSINCEGDIESKYKIFLNANRK